MTLIKELIDIPESVQRGDFVLKLSEGVDRPEETLRSYVVTPELAAHFDEALTFIHSALQSNTSKASYLHGSFGSGKSHFMAVLNLLLRGEPRARSIPELAEVVAKHNAWSPGRKFLLVPYHMIGQADMESGILGGYVEFIRRVHPDAPIPGVYLAEGLFRDAGGLRQKLGDAAFFAALNEGEGGSDGWGDLAAAWDAGRFESATAAAPGSEERAQLISALINRFFGSYDTQAGGRGEAFLSLDKGLSVISRHAQSLGYDAVILFLDELILWLASHAADLRFVHQEGQKLAKLVEAQSADRPVPIISFVARQRDLRELIGDAVPGADRLNFSDSLGHWEGRFHRITLEDRNLPAIAEKRILKCRNEAARRELDASFDVARMSHSVMNILLTAEGDRAMFRRVYPFSPALVNTLIAVSSVLQRERTALKVMMQLLVDQRDTLRLGDIVPVGDLFDVIAHGDEAFNQEMAIHFSNAQRLYYQKLLPLLERQYGRSEELEGLPYDDPKRAAFRADSRLIKTLLLSALVPKAETLRSLNAERLAALNHGSIKTPIPGREAQEVLRRCREWNASVGEIRISEEHNPTISIQLSGVDTETILAQARGEDSLGNRMRRVRQMLYEQLAIQGQDALEQTRELWWKNTKRECIVLLSNVRELPDTSLENDEERWRLVIGYPFDEAGHGPRDGLSKLQAFHASHPRGARTLCWMPSFLSQDALKDLGLLVVLDHILTGEMRFDQYTAHLSPQDRQAAKSLLENQKSSLTIRVSDHLSAAYGLVTGQTPSLDAASRLEASDQFTSLTPGFEPRPPVAATLRQALEGLLGQALSYEFPAAPDFEAEVKSAILNRVLQVALEGAQVQDGRVAVPDRSMRVQMRQIANPLLLGEMGVDATHFVLGQHWKTHFHRKQAETGQPQEVRNLRRWMDEPRAMGLPREVQNLLILVFAAQTGRTFYRHNVVVTPTLANLWDECELREPRLPDEGQWAQAVARASSLFGLNPSPLRNAANADGLARDVLERARQARSECQRYSQRLRDRLIAQRIAYADADRHRTGEAVVELVEQICAPHADVIAALAGARIATSETAMRECLQKAGTLVTALSRNHWELFDGMSRMTGVHQNEARAVLAEVEQAMRSDEHVIPLEASLEGAASRAVRLLTQAAPAAPPPAPALPVAQPLSGQPAPPRPRDAGTQVVSEGGRDDLDFAAARELISGLEAEVRAGRRVQISVRWVVEVDKMEAGEAES